MTAKKNRTRYTAATQAKAVADALAAERAAHEADVRAKVKQIADEAVAEKARKLADKRAADQAASASAAARKLEAAKKARDAADALVGHLAASITAVRACSSASGDGWRAEQHVLAEMLAKAAGQAHPLPETGLPPWALGLAGAAVGALGAYLLTRKGGGK
jgi:hypothetical protein